MGRWIIAQELRYSASPVNNSFGGVAVAAPIDGSGAIYWNPATIGSLYKGEFQFGFGRSSPPWYGDESLAYSLFIPVTLLILAIDKQSDFLNDITDSWIYGDDDSNHSSSSQPHPRKMKIPTVRAWEASYVMAPTAYSHWNYGISVSESGVRKEQIYLNPATGNVAGVQIYRVKNIELIPTVSWRNTNRNFSLGFSPIFSIDEHPTASLPKIPGDDFLGENRGHFGLGMQFGAYWETKSDFNFGFSVRSPFFIPKKTYRWYNASNGEIRKSESFFSQDSPLRFAFGISYNGIDNGLIAMDVRHYDFQHVNSLYNISNQKKRSVTSFGLGTQYQMFEGVALRIGYQYSDGNCSSYEDLLNNATLPIQHGHSMHYGITLGESEYWDITFAGSHSFGEQKISLGNGQYADANPNNSTFWWGLRFHF
ncbi:MAG: outer membrane protein transport protein [Planctomycetaceae bacterium]|jgi:opacity protein-like surface antigen|nr:outer membrane protein transport protein [Planctomycetaceae bacterium]